MNMLRLTRPYGVVLPRGDSDAVYKGLPNDHWRPEQPASRLGSPSSVGHNQQSHRLGQRMPLPTVIARALPTEVVARLGAS